MLNDKKDNKFLKVLNNIDDDLILEIAEASVEPQIIHPVRTRSRFARFIPAAASLAIVAAMGITALIVSRNALTPWGGKNTAATESEPTQSETQPDTQTDSTADTTPSQSSSSTDQEETSISPAEIQVGINTDIISELGMTFDQMTKRYGEVLGGIYNTYNFGGYGRYTWKSYNGEIYDDNMESAGGCNYIDGVKPKELLMGADFPMNLDELSEQYDLVPVSVESEMGMDNCYWAEFKSSLYDNVKIFFGTSTYGIIDEDTSCIVILDVDCLEAKPVITTSDGVIPKLVMLDGNRPTEDEIVNLEYDLSGDIYHDEMNSALYEVNTVFAYPCGTVNADKQKGRSPSIVKLSEGSKWGDFTVTKAEAAYQIPSVAPSNVSYQYLWLKGNISFECKADYIDAERNIFQIRLEVPEETAKILPSIKPYSEFFDPSDDNDGCREFLLDPDCELSKQITEKLQSGEEVTVSVTADELEIRYTYYGLVTDGATRGFLKDVIDFEIK